MKVTLLSDIHGNLPALEEVLKLERDSDLFISLGDVVNYGPWGNECVDRLGDIKAITLKGNHEDYFLLGRFTGENPLVHKFFQSCYPLFARRDVISNYIETYEVGGFLCIHTIHDQYIYEDTPVEITQDALIGHSHVQFVRSERGFRLINVGSVGQNRRQIEMVNYAVLETTTGEVQLRKTPHNIQLCINKMKELKFDDECVAYYVRKASSKE